MFHLGAWFVAIGQTVDTDVTPIADDVLSIQNSHFVLNQPMRLMGAMVMSATLSRAKIASPSMRQIASPYIRPILQTLLPPTNPNMWLLDHQPFSLQPYEEIQLQATSALSMSTENLHAAMWLLGDQVPWPSGNIIPLRITSTTTAVANAWTLLTTTYADTLPTGRYAMLLSEHQATTGVFHRWFFSNQIWRPGFPSTALLGSRLPYSIAKGQWGVMGYFNSNDLPRCYALCNAADTAHEIYAHVVRVGNIYGG